MEELKTEKCSCGEMKGTIYYLDGVLYCSLCYKDFIERQSKIIDNI